VPAGLRSQDRGDQAGGQAELSDRGRDPQLDPVGRAAGPGRQRAADGLDPGPQPRRLGQVSQRPPRWRRVGTGLMGLDSEEGPQRRQLVQDVWVRSGR
jgi:hypothetical protein